ncbi:peptidase C15, pyroglutamyl peptidase I-like protein [Lentithecium fluviatile CBS 122367]|uniref:Peptidase C15, pyroglutamyl peptidase I-like protein n=1 Tax=Lentithecium fluviatile CBS 122367 TaxID=1168545 RepID=A0A6G1IXM5_9PLEO|nr:peptidase C15, pyroglutamyl peptidase I-like protein [Lentithecium fluviatile CBS 122367]
MDSAKLTEEIRVLVTGFGPFLDINTNPSWKIARNLPPTLPSSNNRTINLIVPESYIPAVYHVILAETPSLIAKHDPHIVLHVGLALDRSYFAVEKSAPREGYHDIPDQNRRVFTRAENKKVFGKAPGELATGFELEGVVEAWRDECASIGATAKGKSKSKVKAKEKEIGMADVRHSDDVGTFVCGFIYYVSLLEMQKKGRRDVVFLHVPRLECDEEFGVGIEVVEKLIGVLVDQWKDS